VTEMSCTEPDCEAAADEGGEQFEADESRKRHSSAESATYESTYALRHAVFRSAQRLIRAGIPPCFTCCGPRLLSLASDDCA
jgi:hypothetical protein